MYLSFSLFCSSGLFQSHLHFKPHFKFFLVTKHLLCALHIRILALAKEPSSEKLYVGVRNATIGRIPITVLLKFLVVFES